MTLDKDQTFETPVQQYHRLRSTLKDEATKIGDIIKIANEDHVLLRDLDEISTDLEDGSFKIGMFGVTAAGKSTLTNALLGDSILREGLGETTRTLTRICASEDGRSHGDVVIRYKTIKTIENELDQHLRRSGFGYREGLKINLADPAFRADLRAHVKGEVVDDSDVETACRYIKHLLDGWDECESRLGTESPVMSLEESDALVDEEHVATFIDERILFHNNSITQDGFVFFDAPGLGSSYARHTDEATKLAGKVDAAIVVTKVDYKFMPPDRRFIRDALDVQRMQDRHNLIFVLNQISRINPLQSNPPRPPDQFDECVNEELDRLRDRLRQAGIDDAIIYPVDAACGRWTKSYIQGPLDDKVKYSYGLYSFRHCKGNPEANLKASGIEELSDGLAHHLTSIRYYGFLATGLDRLNRVNDSYHDECKNMLKDLEKTITSLEHELEQHITNKDKALEELTDYFDYTLPGKIQQKYDDLEIKISEVIEESFEILTEAYSKDYKRSIELSQDRYWARIIEQCQPKIQKKIKEIRSDYEIRYNEIKQDTLSNKIPDIVSRYGPDIDWELQKVDLKTTMGEAIRGLEHISLNHWQNVKKYVFSVGGLLREKQKKVILEYLEENYQTKFAKNFGSDIKRWVEKDRVGFGNQVISKFEKLMEQIEGRIKASIDLVKAKGSERQKAIKRLEEFVSICDQTNYRLQELEVEIEKSRPSDMKEQVV